MKLNIFEYSAPVRSWLLLVIYALELCASLWMAYELRFDFMLDSAAQTERLFVLLWLVPLQLVMLGLFHQLRPLLGYFSTPDLARMFHALTLSVVVALVVWTIWGAGVAPPRGVIVIDFVFALVGLTGVRLAMRTLRESLHSPARNAGRRRKRVGIIGAGDAGAVLAHELSLRPGSGLQPVAFFDDNTGKWNSRVHDIPVLGPPERLVEVCKKLDIQQAIIAMPSAPAKRIGEVVRLLREARLPCLTVPSLDQLALGQVRVSQLRNIEVQDLLGREKVELANEDIRSVLQDRVILVTGAGGSIGSELCRQIATYHPKRLLLLDRSEPAVFQIEQELIGLGHGERIVPIVADILDRAHIADLFSDFHPEVVFHAAAHKHVPMMEHQPGEAIRNNTLGSAQLADMALEAGVDRFILISTDKAINPTSVMGATKRLAEMYVQAKFANQRRQTKFMAVRFGNVLGSSGSVIPIFQRQIAEGGPVKVTHPEMTRYFMTIPEASMLVLQSATQGEGGEIFVLDMGKPVKIVDLARQMIELSGLKPDEDIQIEFTGTRPGEKLFEELRHTGENYAPTTHPKICRFISQPMELEAIEKVLQRLEASLYDSDADQIKQLLREVVPDYSPHLSGPANHHSTITELKNYRRQARPMGQP
jgi:FlaA1/EpsC-like NDP-sugar epimerase